RSVPSQNPSIYPEGMVLRMHHSATNHVPSASQGFFDSLENDVGVHRLGQYLLRHLVAVHGHAQFVRHLTVADHLPHFGQLHVFHHACHSNGVRMFKSWHSRVSVTRARRQVAASLHRHQRTCCEPISSAWKSWSVSRAFTLSIRASTSLRSRTSGRFMT